MSNLLAYLAGYFDGEGSICFGVDKRHGSNPRLRIRVCSGDREVIEKFAEFFGMVVKPVKTLPKNAKRQQYDFYAAGEKAQTVLSTLLPFLVAKKELAELALTLKFGQGGIKLSEEERLQRAWVHAKVQAINQRITVC